jgi:PAS domain S-box-containing protein
VSAQVFRGLSALVFERSGAALDGWKARAREIPPARHLAEKELLDNFPGFLDALAQELARAEAGGTPRLPRREAMEHAMTRLGAGYDVGEVVQEWVLLRDALVAALPEPGLDLSVVHRAIDRGMLVSMETYSAAHARGLEALDEITRHAFESDGADDLLTRFADALVRWISSADAALILLRRREAFETAAVAGRGARDGSGVELASGARILEEVGAPGVTAPIAVPEPWPEELAKWTAGLRGLAGAPLRADGALVGVVLVGSLHAADLGDWDTRLFGSMAVRAAAALGQQRLRDALARQAAESTASEARARRSARWLEGIVSAAMEGILVVSRTRRIVFVNEAALRIFAVPREELMALPIDSFPQRFGLAAPDGAASIPLAARALEGELVEPVERSIARDDGTARTLRASAAPLFSDGTVEGAVVVVSDISSLKAAVAERERAFADLEAERARLERANRFRDEVLATVSHDLRNPLGAIVASAAVLTRLVPKEPPVVRPLDTIRRAADRMTHLIGDLLDTASIEAGHLSIKPAPQSAAALLREAALLHESVARAHGIALRITPPSPDAPVLADRERLMQVFSNLIGNAIRVSNDGGGIVLQAAIQGDDVRFTVADDGPGVPDDLRGRLFEPFVTGEATRGTGGVGLGLFIASAIVAAHGGRLSVENRPEGGAVFAFTIPRAAK